MTNTKLLREKINQSGYKLTFVASQLRISYQGFLNKVNNKTEFTATEIATLKTLLNLTAEECTLFFFAA